MKTFVELLRASFKQFSRDKAALFITIAFPVIFMLTFGLIFSGGNNYKADIGLAYEGDSQLAATIEQAFQSVPSFSVATGNLDDLLSRLKKGELSAVVEVPAGADAAVAAHQAADLQLYYDPSNTTTTQVTLPIVNQVIEQVDRQISQEPAVLNIQSQSIQAHAMSAIDYLVPGVIAMSIMFTGLFCAVPLIQQRERKILKRWSATPLQRSSLIYSQIAFRLVLAVVQTLLLVFIASSVFHVQMLGNWGVLLGLVVAGALCLVSIGYLVASFIKTQEAAMPVLQLVQFPMMFLSGIFFPLDTLPAFMKPVVSAMPLTYLGDALRQTMVQATPAHALLLDLAVMAGVMVVCMALSIRFFRWE